MVTMRAFHIDRFDDIKGLTVREHEVPEPGPHEVLVRVRAASLNYRDLMILNRTYPTPGHEGVIPLSDGAGEVVRVGDGVTRVKPGDRVCSTYFLGFVDGRPNLESTKNQLGASVDGMLAEYRVLHEEWVVRIADHLSFVEGSTLPCAALAAWSAVHGDQSLVGPDDTVLVLGTGGVALFAVQFAVALGARVIGATSSDAKAALLRSLGVKEVVNYKSTVDWNTEVVEITEGKGVDLVVEAVGPATLERSIRSLGFGGHISMLGVFRADANGFDPNVFAGRMFTLRRIAVGNRVGLEQLNELMAEHELRPVIDRIFDFAEAPAAYEHVQAGRHLGKVVIQV
jgi:NADPH:quinone reductase-like Zn-dependent oxidoreductase